jgi:hypothetical protein
MGLVMTLACSSPVRADDTMSFRQPLSKYVTFVNQTRGALLIEAHSDIGTFTGKSGNTVDIRALECSADTVKFDAVQIMGIVVDLDEIPSVLAGIDSLLRVNKTNTKLDYFGASFASEGGLRFVKGDNASSDAGKIRIGPVDGEVGTFTPDEMLQIRALIVKAQNVLKSVQ